MNEKLNTASRWLLALAVILIPLSVIAVVSSAWAVNWQFGTNQWTKYLLFAAWILLSLSVVTGIANLISPPEMEAAAAEAAAPPPVASASGEEEEVEESAERVPVKKGKPAFNLGYAFLLAQACTFALGMIFYVTYISWMILGLQAYPSTPGL